MEETHSCKCWYLSTKFHDATFPDIVTLTFTAKWNLHLEWWCINLEERGISYTRLTPYRVVQQTRIKHITVTCHSWHYLARCCCSLSGRLHLVAYLTDNYLVICRPGSCYLPHLDRSAARNAVSTPKTASLVTDDSSCPVCFWRIEIVWYTTNLQCDLIVYIRGFPEYFFMFSITLWLFPYLPCHYVSIH